MMVAVVVIRKGRRRRRRRRRAKTSVVLHCLPYIPQMGGHYCHKLRIIGLDPSFMID